MTLRTFIVVALIAVFSVIVAMTSLRHSPATGEKLLFPDLINKMNDISIFTIKSATGSMTARRSPRGWHLDEWDGYPADVSRIRAMVAEMVRAVLLESKTADVGRHALLDLADPAPAADSAESPAEGRGRELTLQDANGNVLAAIIIGRRRFDLGAGGEGVYVRRPGEAQTWLARTGLFPTTTTDIRGWVESTVMGLNSARLGQVTLRHPNGQIIRVTHPNNGTPTTGHPLPPNTPPNTKGDENARHRMFALLSHITLENVRKTKTHESQREATRAFLTTHDGLQINVTAYHRDGATWLALTANAALESPAAVHTEADTLRNRHHTWLYQIPSYIAAVFHTRPQDIR